MLKTLEVDLNKDLLTGDDEPSSFDLLVLINRRWLSHYARLHAEFSIDESLFAKNSVWMNAYFQKLRMTTPPESKQGMSYAYAHCFLSAGCMCAAL